MKAIKKLIHKIIDDEQRMERFTNFFGFVPDSLMLKIIYYLWSGRKLELKNPTRYTEKMQWYKLHYRTPLMTCCADKLKVREYVTSKGLGYLLNELYAVYDNAIEIDFETLPNSFVIKANHASGTNILVPNKSQLDIPYTRQQLDLFMKKKLWIEYREWAYKEIKPKIIVEKHLELDENDDLPDYKFFCFDGKVFCLYHMTDYTQSAENGRMGFYDRDFNQLDVTNKTYKRIEKCIEKPKNFREMVSIAEILSKDFPHVRVDLYNIDGRIIFGELTFYSSGGFIRFDPDEFDYVMGKQFTLPQKK